MGTLIIFLLGISLLLNAFLGWQLLHRRSSRQDSEPDFLDEELERFSNEIDRYLEAQQLWPFAVNFCKDLFDLPMAAVVTLRFDVEPYQIACSEGFDAAAIAALLRQHDSPLLEKLAVEKQLLNRSDRHLERSLSEAMAASKLHLAAPVTWQQKLLGFILLGSEAPPGKIPPRQIHALKMICARIGRAMENIHTVQRTLDAQKMAGIGMLTSQLAHDFKSFISLTKLQSEENSKLAKQAIYMEKMVQEMLNYSRPQELKLTAVDINQLIDMSLDLITIPAEIQLEKHYADDLPRINVDISQMRRVFQNLISNSLRAMRYSEGKRLKITTRTLRPLSQVHKNPWVYIEILDEGTGIKEEFLERIFDPFYTEYKHEGGSGLGLAIVKQIINRHSGHIDVSSKPGKATIFNIRLPYQTA